MSGDEYCGKGRLSFGVLSTQNMAFETQMVTVPKEH